MKQLTLAIKFTAKEENRTAFKQILTDLFHSISKEKNFVNATLHEGIQDINEFYVYETWNDNLENFFAVQMKSPYVAEFEKQLDLLEVKREPAAYSPFAFYGTHIVK